MEPTVHTHLGKDRRIAIPARFCEEANLRPGTGFLLSLHGSQLVLTPLEDEAERMRRNLRDMLGQDADLAADLRELRTQDFADDDDRR